MIPPEVASITLLAVSWQVRSMTQSPALLESLGERYVGISAIPRGKVRGPVALSSDVLFGQVSDTALGLSVKWAGTGKRCGVTRGRSMRWKDFTPI